MSLHYGESHLHNPSLTLDDGSSEPQWSYHGGYSMPCATDGLTAISEPSEPRAADFDPQDSCVIRNISKRRPSDLRFLGWVAYKRRFADSITEAERRTCPLLWCRQVFHDEDAMLQHVWTCPCLAKGLYWCYDCQKVERVGKIQCKRCHYRPSPKDRLANLAKKIFSLLGTRAAARRGYSHQKDGGKQQPPHFSMDIEGFWQAPSPHDGPHILGSFGGSQSSNADMSQLAELDDMGTPTTGEMRFEMGDQTDYSELAVPSRHASFKATLWPEKNTSAVTEKGRNDGSWGKTVATPLSTRQDQPLRLNTQVSSSTQQDAVQVDLPDYWSVTSPYPTVSPLSPSTGIDPSRLNISPTETESSSASFNTNSDSQYSSGTSLSHGSFSSTAWSFKADHTRSVEFDDNPVGMKDIIHQSSCLSEHLKQSETWVGDQHGLSQHPQDTELRVFPVGIQFPAEDDIAPPYTQGQFTRHQEHVESLFGNDVAVDGGCGHEPSAPQADSYVDDIFWIDQLLSSELRSAIHDIHDPCPRVPAMGLPLDYGPSHRSRQVFENALVGQTDEILRNQFEYQEAHHPRAPPPVAPTPSHQRLTPQGPFHSFDATTRHSICPLPLQPPPSRRPNSFHQPPPTNLDFLPLLPIPTRRTAPKPPVPFTNIISSPAPPSPSTAFQYSISTPPLPTIHPVFQNPNNKSPEAIPSLVSPPPPPPSPSNLQPSRSVHQCPICDTKFCGNPHWRASNLRRHMRTTHSSSRLRCSHPGCTSDFSRTDNLQAHRKKFGHGNEEDAVLQVGPAEVRDGEFEEEEDEEDTVGLEVGFVMDWRSALVDEREERAKTERPKRRKAKRRRENIWDEWQRGDMG